jgi:hypothetical protein
MNTILGLLVADAMRKHDLTVANDSGVILLGVSHMRVSKYILFCIYSISSLACIADDLTRSDFEQSFIGKEWRIGDYGNRNTPQMNQCYVDGGAFANPNLTLDITYFTCNGRQLMLLGTSTEKRSPNDTVRVLDALLLPKIKSNERFMEPGECEVKGKTVPYFIARVNLGRREEVNWKTGVKAAWTVDIDQQKIIPLSTRDIVCYRPTPP